MATGDSSSGLFSPPGNSAQEPRSLTPWVIAGLVVVLVIAALALISHHRAPANPGGAGLAPADPYAAKLVISDIKMSEATSVGGAKLTYLDGMIANHGDKTVTGITLQVAFHDFTNLIGQKETMQLNLIRTHEPYIDTQPVSAAPIKPGDSREFRLIFDHVADNWNQAYPELRIIEVTAR